jgi:hypothetical protein
MDSMAPLALGQAGEVGGVGDAVQIERAKELFHLG